MSGPLVEEHVYWCEAPDRDCICPGGPNLVAASAQLPDADREALHDMIDSGNRLWAAVGPSASFAQAVASAVDAGVGFTIEGPTHDSPGELATLTTFVDDDGDQPFLICEGVNSIDELCDRIVWVAAQQKAGWV